MSEVQLIIRDANQEIQAHRHGSFAQSIVAALSAQPETIEELDTALERFIARDGGSYFYGFSSGADDEPYDAGLIIVDLAARLVVCDSTYFAASHEGSVTYHDGKRSTEVEVRYHLSTDWRLTRDAMGWEVRARELRRARELSPPLDVRAVVYGEPLLRFIVERCFEVFKDQGTAAEPNEDAPRFQHEEELLREIHVQWLMTPRDELCGRTPRQAMMAERRFVQDSLQDRELQWSYMNWCPPGLEPDSAAYRFAGFGTHEMVVYYDLVRELLWCCRYGVSEEWSGSRAAGLTREAFIEAEVAHLSRLRENWLDSPFSESGDHTARSIIHNERARVPATISGHEAMIDEDCPLCRLQAEWPGPIFWHLDGCNMDGDFAFSFYHETLQEWEDEKREEEESSRRFHARRAEQERLGVKYPGPDATYVNPDIAWKLSFSAHRYTEAPLKIRLFAIGEPLSRLIVDLKEPPQEACSDSSTPPREQRELADGLAEGFCSLREIVESPDPRVETHSIILRHLARLRDVLQAVAETRPELTFGCADLQNRLSRFLEPPRETEEESRLSSDDSVPS